MNNLTQSTTANNSDEIASHDSQTEPESEPGPNSAQLNLIDFSQAPATLTPISQLEGVNDPNGIQIERNASGENSYGKSIETWQYKNLRLMQGIIIVLGVVFFVATIIQLAVIQVFIQDAPKFEHRLQIDFKEYDPNIPFKELVEFEKRKALIALEGFIIDRRYYQASVSMLSRTWIRYLDFMTGMVLSLVGATFILGKIKEEGIPTDIETKNKLASLTIKSTSPGLILAVLGVFLMATATIVRHPLDVQDKPIYITDIIQVDE